MDPNFPWTLALPTSTSFYLSSLFNPSCRCQSRLSLQQAPNPWFASFLSCCLTRKSALTPFHFPALQSRGQGAPLTSEAAGGGLQVLAAPRVRAVGPGRLLPSPQRSQCIPGKGLPPALLPLSQWGRAVTPGLQVPFREVLVPGPWAPHPSSGRALGAQPTPEGPIASPFRISMPPSQEEAWGGPHPTPALLHLSAPSAGTPGGRRGCQVTRFSQVQSPAWCFGFSSFPKYLLFPSAAQEAAGRWPAPHGGAHGPPSPYSVQGKKSQPPQWDRCPWPLASRRRSQVVPCSAPGP